jgi:hypothetical protein
VVEVVTVYRGVMYSLTARFPKVREIQSLVGLNILVDGSS